MQIRFKIEGLENIRSFFLDVSRTVPHVVINAIAEHLKNALQQDRAQYKYISRASAYGSTGATFENGNPVPDGYFSAKQFRYVMAKITDGTMTPGTENRTGKSAAGWGYNPIAEGENTGYITNQTPGAYYTTSDIGQARQPAKVGWLKNSIVIAKNIVGALSAAKDAVDKFIISSKGK